MSDRFTNFPNSIGINGTEITSTAAELNIMDNVTATAAEINYLDIAALGTGVASKAVVLNSGDDYTWPATGVLTYGVLKDGPAAVTITATGAEINYLDITTLGTGAASKAVVLDAGEDYTWPATGILTYGVLKDSAATTITATGAEINYLDITTLGTGAASKAVVLDAGDDYTWPATGVLTYGVLKDSAATTIVATGAEINRACDVSTRVVSLTATAAINEADHEGKVLMMADVGGDTLCTFTLPAATGGGARYKFYVGIVNTSNYVIKVNAAPGTDAMKGQVLTNSTGDAAAAAVIAWTTTTDDTITLNGTTSGGVSIGDWIELVDALSGVWTVTGVTTASGAEVTPFSATVP